jgi:hypothetical protein
MGLLEFPLFRGLPRKKLFKQIQSVGFMQVVKTFVLTIALTFGAVGTIALSTRDLAI